MKYNLDKLINSLMAGLNARQKDILASRYGLKNAWLMTLASIGDKYSITRERVRQVEASALNSVRAEFAKSEYNDLVYFLKNHLNKQGGLCRESLLCQNLNEVIVSSDAKTYTNKIKFLLESCGAFKCQPEDNNFHAFWYVDDKDIQEAGSLINKVTAILDNKKDLSAKDKIISSLNYKPALAANYINVSKRFATNAYNDFGLAQWSEISPRTSRDWAYLILKKEGRPLHFTVLTDNINKLRKNKNTNPQTVHNELIKDERFVLVGRGTYGLREFNLISGTAREVIAHMLDKHGPQDSKNIIKLVLNQRIFKENTLLLNLQDRRFFERLDNGKYTIRKV